MKMRLKVSSVKWRPCCLGLNVLTKVDTIVVWINQVFSKLKLLDFHYYAREEITWQKQVHVPATFYNF